MSSEDLIRYDVLASEALRGIIRTVLQRVQKRGLPGEHHFFINFDTGAPGVTISKRLKEKYPEEMTIVLQHKFWDLLVSDDRFEVKLSFSSVPERLVIPFTAIKSFYDPSVQFGFNPNLFAISDAQALVRSPQETGNLPVASSAEPEAAGRATAGEVPTPARKDDEAEPQTAKVVELDLFRKK